MSTPSDSNEIKETPQHPQILDSTYRKEAIEKILFPQSDSQETSITKEPEKAIPTSPDAMRQEIYLLAQEVAMAQRQQKAEEAMRWYKEEAEPIFEKVSNIVKQLYNLDNLIALGISIADMKRINPSVDIAALEARFLQLYEGIISSIEVHAEELSPRQPIKTLADMLDDIGDILEDDEVTAEEKINAITGAVIDATVPAEEPIDEDMLKEAAKQQSIKDEAARTAQRLIDIIVSSISVNEPSRRNLETIFAEKDSNGFPRIFTEGFTPKELAVLLEQKSAAHIMHILEVGIVQSVDYELGKIPVEKDTPRKGKRESKLVIRKKGGNPVINASSN